MVIVEFDKLNEFERKHPDAKKIVGDWKLAIKKATWNSSQDVLHDFPNARMFAANRASFEIAENVYRLVILIMYEFDSVKIRFIGTQNEYDLINPETI
jgi:mRNA interferase HigB